MRVGVGSARIMLRAAEVAAGCALRAGSKATAAATQAASNVSDAIASGRPSPTFPPDESPSSEATGPVISDLRPTSERSVNGDLSETFEGRSAITTPTQEPTPPQPESEPQRPPAPESPPAAEPQPPEPVHVSEEPELVEEVAEPGAEDGAGAAVTVDEPWPGYARMTAKQVIERLAQASPAELAAVQLYESAHRNRQTVRAAAERNLKSKTGRGSPN
ncbi:MAG: hypothetical protein ACTHQQ_08485 [Solirubrobacteraceae bacterium]